MYLVDAHGVSEARRNAPEAVGAASRGEPALRRRRRRFAADRASTRRRLIPPHPGDHRKCSAKALFQRGFIRAINAFQIPTVEDQSRGWSRRCSSKARKRERVSRTWRKSVKAISGRAGGQRSRPIGFLAVAAAALGRRRQSRPSSPAASRRAVHFRASRVVR
jgi:hypothetical protein